MGSTDREPIENSLESIAADGELGPAKVACCSLVSRAAGGLCGWLLASAALAFAVGSVALHLQHQSVAPAILLPLAVGAALGAGGVGIVRLCAIPSRRLALAGTIAWGLLAVVGQDFLDYRAIVRRYEDQYQVEQRKDPAVGLARAAGMAVQPPGFGPFLIGRFREQPFWWSLDAALTIGAALAVTAVATGRQSLAAAADRPESKLPAVRDQAA